MIHRRTVPPLRASGLLCISDVIANPLGEDADDFPSTMYLEQLEDEVLAVASGVEAHHPARLMAQKPKQ